MLSGCFFFKLQSEPWYFLFDFRVAVLSIRKWCSLPNGQTKVAKKMEAMKIRETTLLWANIALWELISQQDIVICSTQLGMWSPPRPLLFWIWGLTRHKISSHLQPWAAMPSLNHQFCVSLHLFSILFMCSCYLRCSFTQAVQVKVSTLHLQPLTLDLSPLCNLASNPCHNFP